MSVLNEQLVRVLLPEGSMQRHLGSPAEPWRGSI
jgi:hypothetical protein